MSGLRASAMRVASVDRRGAWAAPPQSSMLPPAGSYSRPSPLCCPRRPLWLPPLLLSFRLVSTAHKPLNADGSTKVGGVFRFVRYFRCFLIARKRVRPFPGVARPGELSSAVAHRSIRTESSALLVSRCLSRRPAVAASSVSPVALQACLVGLLLPLVLPHRLARTRAKGLWPRATGGAPATRRHRPSSGCPACCPIGTLRGAGLPAEIGDLRPEWRISSR